MVSVFSFKLDQKIIPRLLTVGKYDGVHPCLTGATSGGKVFIHSPHLSHLLGSSDTAGRLVDTGSPEVTLLNIGQQITALSAGVPDDESSINADAPHDMLFIGTQNHLLAYNVEQNRDVFYKDMPDGANVIVFGNSSKDLPKLVYTGGNCTIQAFDSEGNDHFWTVTGDNVTSLCFVDINLDGIKEMVVGSEDFDIRIFKGDDLVGEISENDVVTALCALTTDGSMYAYSLANGTIGVYNGTERIWRQKSKYQPGCLFSYDINGDGEVELVTGWSNGKIDVRKIKTGEVVFKDTLGSAIAGIVQADYRMDGNQVLICCSVDGEVRGYLPSTKDLDQCNVKNIIVEQDTLIDLSQKKQNLLQELANFDSNQKVLLAKDAPERQSLSLGMGVILAGTTLRTEFTVFMSGEGEKPHLMLSVKTNNETILRSLMVFSEGMFDGESYASHPAQEDVSAEIRIPFYPPKDVPMDLQIKALVGKPEIENFHVFEIARSIPRFSLYVPCQPTTDPKPSSKVEFKLTERLERITNWLTSNFLFEPGEGALTMSFLEVAYLSLRTSTPIIIKFDTIGDGKMTLETDDMDLAGDIIQSLAEYLQLEDLEVVCDFPKHMEELLAVLIKVDEFHNVREQLSSQMAEDASFIRSWIVRAECARLIENWPRMVQSYIQLYDLNHDLISGYKIRCNNHNELLEYLKVVNQAIQKAGRLRVGKPKAIVISSCHKSIKEGNYNNLIRVIKYGHIQL